MVVARVYKYVKHFEGFPERSNFNIVEEELPALEDGEFLTEAIFLSVDPDIRKDMKHFELGSTVAGQQIGMISSSKNEKFPVGSYVCAPFGWRTHTISNGEITSDSQLQINPYVVPQFGDYPKSLSLGVLGMPGNAAYFGLLEICNPQAGETVVVTAAAGSVGTVAGQIAKIKGCTVIGIAGSQEKGAWLTGDLRFDHFINYKTDNIDQKLTEFAPKKIDCYFDNVGGRISMIVMNHMNNFGRIAVCGLLDVYNEENREDGYHQLTILNKQLKIEGFHINRWLDRWTEGIMQIFHWMLNGDIKYKETITEGFDNMFDAFVDLWNGVNVGKSIVKVK